MVLDEISLIGKRILKFTDLRLISTKRVHTKFFGNFHFIIIGDFYQVQHVRDAGVFKINMNNIDSLTPIFWMEKIKCYELKQIMHQSDEQFINILNHFRTATQSQSNINTINSQCFCTPPKDPKIPYLFYTNEARLKHNELTVLQSDGDVYIFHVEYKHHDTCPTHFSCKMIRISLPNYIYNFD
jgi:hypothetical protein